MDDPFLLKTFFQIRDELSVEVTRLTEELEQMKTRVADLSKDTRKNQVSMTSHDSFVNLIFYFAPFDRIGC